MNENKKRVIALLGAFAAVVLLAAICFAISKSEPSADKIPSVEEEERAIKLFGISDEDIDKIVIKAEGGTFSFERKEEVIKTDEDGRKTTEIVYKCPEYPNALLSQSKIKNMLYDFYDFYAEELISEDMSRKEEFGFSENNNSVTVIDKGGEETEFILGAKSSVSESYYVMKNGEDKIYLMSGYKAPSFLNGFSKYRETALGDIDTSTILSFSVTNKGERVMGIRYKNPNDKDVVTTDFMTYVMVFPYSGAVNIEAFSDLAKPFGGVEAIDFVAEDTNNLRKYGLNSPVKVVLQDAGRVVHTLYFGDKDEKGNVYTIYNDYNFIFTTSPEMFDAISDISPFEYLEKFANIYSIEDVEKVEISEGENKYEMNIKRRTGYATVYEINGEEATEEAFKAAYETIIGLSVTSEAEKKAESVSVGEIKFFFRGGKTAVTKIYEYDERNYGILKNDGDYNLTLKKNVDGLFDVIERFSKKPTVMP